MRRQLLYNILTGLLVLATELLLTLLNILILHAKVDYDTMAINVCFSQSVYEPNVTVFRR